MAKVIKESNFDFKLHSGHLEQTSNVFKERFAQLHDIKPVIMFHVNPFKALSKLQTLFMKHVEGSELEILEQRLAENYK
jgi:hypothetical protein